MLTISNLCVTINSKKIIAGIDLLVRPGEIHAIMGPNGSGKSTLANVIAGHSGYTISGSITFYGKDLLAMEPEIRACEGVFLAFQYPIEIPGISTINFLKTALNALRKYRGEQPLDAMEFWDLVQTRMSAIEIEESMLKRFVNVGFSGGEKKRNEIFSMAILQPRLAILDEIDSGLDIDSLRIVASGINNLRNPQRSMIVITHYQRLLDYLSPDYVHILLGGKIVRSGGKELALELESKGYISYDQ